MEIQNDGKVEDFLGESYKCDSCGAPMVYRPGTNTLLCEHCGTTKEIEDSDEIRPESQDFIDFMQGYAAENFQDDKVVECMNCRAILNVDENLTSMKCPYCDSPLIEGMVHNERSVKPEYLCPFNIPKNQTFDILKKWASGLWFAPNALKKALLQPMNLRGVYMPYWAYDAVTDTTYTGERGRRYTVVVGVGKNRRTETRIAWTFVSGRISTKYEEILVRGTETLEESILSKVGHWNTQKMVKYNPSYLSGFITEKYKIDIKKGFDEAQKQIREQEKTYVRRDIGGDAQRINKMNVAFHQVKFKHVLLPIYISSFTFKNKDYSFYINGVSGNISGKRPYSFFKIFFAVLLGLAILAGLYYWISLSQNPAPMDNLYDYDYFD